MGKRARQFESCYTPEPDSGCWLWNLSLYRHGYGKCYRRLHGEGYAHRWSWVIHNGPIPGRMQVLHKCDVRHCVNPEHLFLGTQLDNIRDMDRKGRRVRKGPRGEAARSAKLTAQQVVSIRQDSRPASAISPEYGVQVSAINKVKRRATWGHVQ